MSRCEECGGLQTAHKEEKEKVWINRVQGSSQVPVSATLQKWLRNSTCGMNWFRVFTSSSSSIGLNKVMILGETHIYDDEGVQERKVDNSLEFRLHQVFTEEVKNRNPSAIEQEQFYQDLDSFLTAGTKTVAIQEGPIYSSQKTLGSNIFWRYTQRSPDTIRLIGQDIRWLNLKDPFERKWLFRGDSESLPVYMHEGGRVDLSKLKPFLEFCQYALLKKRSILSDADILEAQQGILGIEEKMDFFWHCRQVFLRLKSGLESTETKQQQNILLKHIFPFKLDLNEDPTDVYEDMCSRMFDVDVVTEMIAKLKHQLNVIFYGGLTHAQNIQRLLLDLGSCGAGSILETTELFERNDCQKIVSSGDCVLVKLRYHHSLERFIAPNLLRPSKVIKVTTDERLIYPQFDNDLLLRSWAEGFVNILRSYPLSSSIQDIQDYLQESTTPAWALDYFNRARKLLTLYKNRSEVIPQLLFFNNSSSLFDTHSSINHTSQLFVLEFEARIIASETLSTIFSFRTGGTGHRNHSRSGKIHFWLFTDSKIFEFVRYGLAKETSDAFKNRRTYLWNNSSTSAGIEWWENVWQLI